MVGATYTGCARKVYSAPIATTICRTGDCGGTTIARRIHSVFVKYFDEVRRCGSIRQAARNLHVASSAVNRQILKAEDDLGVSLFERTAHGLRLTAAGALLAAHISRTLEDADRTLGEIRSLQTREAGTVSIAGPESVIEHLLPPVLAEFHARYPGGASVFKATSDVSQRLADMLGGCEIDIAITFDPPRHPTIRQVAECELPVGAVMTPDHPLADHTRITLADCTGFPLVLPDPTWPLRSELDPLIHAAGLEDAVITSSNSVELLRLMIGSRLGIGFQTLVGIESMVTSGRLVLVPIHNPAPLTQSLAICISAERQPTAAIDFVVGLLRDRLQSYGI